MKSLRESILDVDTNIDELEIPEKPKVSKKDYPAYEQAWYNTLVALLNKNDKKTEDFLIFFKYYKEWLSDWVCLLDVETYYETYEDNEIEWYGEVYDYIFKDDNDMVLDFLNDLIDECSSGASSYRMNIEGSGSFLYTLYDPDNLFNGALKEGTFEVAKFRSAYKRFKKNIDKIFTLHHIKL